MQGDRNSRLELPLKNILDASFKANPEYQLMLYDRLPAYQQENLRDLTKDPDFYGVLVPRNNAAGSAKSVCCNTALLLLTLSEAGPLPKFVRAALGGKCNLAVSELVLDGVLQIERDGTYVCGSDAFDLIYAQRESVEPLGKLALLTRTAIQYAQSLDIDDSGKLSARLYFYNRLPLSTAWKRRFPTQESVVAHLGIQNGKGGQHRLGSRWKMLPATTEFEGWFYWVNQTERADTPESGTKIGYKLYLSPQPDSVRDAFRVLLECVAHSAAHHVKVGNDAAGLLRPDKMVAYFDDFDSLQETAQEVGDRLKSCAAQGVPFTAELGHEGLLSWGIDPPAERGTLSWLERPSWRLWVTNRLAAALLAAKTAPRPGIEPWRFALERLRLANVDTDTWTPLAGFEHPEESVT